METQLVLTTFVTGLFVTVIGVLAYQRYLDLQRERKQKLGLRYLSQLKSLLMQLQKHRGMSSRLLWGDSKLDHELSQHKRNIDQHIIELDHFHGHKFLAGRWDKFKKDWYDLVESHEQITAEENLEIHNQIILVFIYFIEDVAEQHDVAETYLHGLNIYNKNWKKVLSTAEWIGQARVLGSGMLSKHENGNVERIRMRFIRSKLASYKNQVKVDESTMEKLDQFVGMLEKEFLAQESSDLSSNWYFDEASKVLESFMSQFENEMTEMKNSIH